LGEIDLPPPPELAVLAGAGISLPSPSRLPDGRTFMREVLRRIKPSGAEEKWILSAMDLPETRLRRPGEFLRFEILMHTLRQSGLDPELRVLDCYDACGQPNYNHFVLADLIRQGAVVITTNFDRLIEIAWTRLSMADGKKLQVAAFDGDFPREGVVPEGPPTLWKIHGSLSVDGRDTRASVQATMVSVLSIAKTGAKRAFLEEVLRSRDLLVVGYSGYDDLDLVPVLADTHSDRSLFWIDHVSGQADWKVSTAEELQATSKIYFENDAVGRDRLSFVTDPHGRQIRSTGRSFLVKVDTRRVMEMLGGAAAYSIDDSPGETVSQAYFDAWEQKRRFAETARCEIAISIFERQRFRPDVRRQLEQLERLLVKFHLASDDPHDALLLATNRYNITSSAEDLETLRRKVEALEPTTPAGAGHRLRLLACIAWKLQGPEVGDEMFAEAVRFDRERVGPESELATLVTWRGHAGFSPWGDNIPQEESARIDQLAEEIGYLPVIWNQEIERHSMVIDEEQDLMPIYRKYSRMRRHSIDIGDVLGEAMASLIIGRLFLLDQQSHLAVEEFLRVKELDRLLMNGELTKNANWFLSHCENLVTGQAKRMESAIRQSLWAGRDS